MTTALRANGVKAVVLDVEGTTTPMSFVHDALFPYARAHLREHLRSAAGTAAMRKLERTLRTEHAADVQAGNDPPALIDLPPRAVRESIAAYLEWLMDRDRKSPALKELQGEIWEQGYAQGRLKGAVFADVPRALARWHRAGVRVAIYSSGSVKAQQLLFENTAFGDLTSCIDAYFDTGVGPKRESASYTEVARRLTLPAHEILFISDVTAELAAAAAAGLQCTMSVRPGNAETTSTVFSVIHSFDETD